MENNPSYENDKFICPHCNTLAKQDWMNSYKVSQIIKSIYQHNFLNYRKNIEKYPEQYIDSFLKYMDDKIPNDVNHILPLELSISICQSCEKFSVWAHKSIIYPQSIIVDLPNNDLDDEIKSLYNEAALIFQNSPKGATAILRLALQKLLIQLGKDGKNINNDIKALVAEGLNPKMQKALDLLRVVGNNAVHPGQINLDDNKEIALHLFKILNMIAEDMITKPKEMDALYDDIIPEDTKGHINQRDGKT